MSEPAASSQSSNSKPTLTELFHRLNSVIPDDQKLIAIEPETPVAEAIDLLERHGYSQVPVVVGREVLGLFSYRSFSSAVIKHNQAAGKNKKFELLDLTVEECMNSKPLFARVTDEFSDWFDALDRHDAILVGEPNRLRNIVTSMDILRYLYRVASPFVLISEIELALRALMNMAVNEETLAKCARECLKDKYEPDRIPTKITDMTFNDYIQIIGHGNHWTYFSEYFGGNRTRTRTKLEQIRDLRNVVFHFRRSVSVEEHEALVTGRDWMLGKIRAAVARHVGASQ
jgi:predicted transcriptional regulator